MEEVVELRRLNSQDNRLNQLYVVQLLLTIQVPRPDITSSAVLNREIF